MFGCGYDDRLRGNGTGVASPADRFEEEGRTCPEFYARTPFVSSVWRYLGAFRIGALGPIWELDNLLLECLHIVDAEAKAVDAAMTEKLYED